MNSGLGMVERRLLLKTKDAPITHITQEIPRVLEAVCQEPGQTPTIISYYHTCHNLGYKKVENGEEEGVSVGLDFSFQSYFDIDLKWNSKIQQNMEIFLAVTCVFQKAGNSLNASYSG